MAVVNCRKYDNEVDTKAGAHQKRRMPVPNIRMAFKIMGSIITLSFIAAIPSAYGSEPSGTSHTATAAQPSSAAPMATKNASHGGLSSLTAGAEDAPQIVWEPIGKYSQKEISVVSDTVGQLFSHMKKNGGDRVEYSAACSERGQGGRQRCGDARSAKI